MKSIFYDRAGEGRTVFMEKIASSIMLTLLLASMLTLAFNTQPVKAEPKTWTVDDDGPADFHTIQEAIDYANPGDAIFVYNGTYEERLAINKDSLTLIGSKREAFINGTISISANNVIVEEFTIIWDVVFVYYGGVPWVTYPIVFLENCNSTTISSNVIQGYTVVVWWGPPPAPPSIYVDGLGCGISKGSNNVIRSNKIDGCMESIFAEMGENHLIVGNDFRSTFSAYIDCNNAIIHHNNFHAGCDDGCIRLQGNNITLDNSYPSGGNHWSDYTGTDLFKGPHQNETGSDGIGDVPYVIYDNVDRYPLMFPVPPFTIPSDVNYDGVVNILDIVLIASTYGCKEGDPNWNPDADLAPPYGKIDIFDIVTCTYHYGEAYL